MPRGRDLTAKRAAIKIRQMRTGNTPQEGPGELYERLMMTIRDFQAKHPDVPPSFLERELELVLETFGHVRYCG